VSTNPKPVLPCQATNAGELGFIVGDERMAECDGLSRDEQIITADRRAGPAQAARVSCRRPYRPVPRRVKFPSGSTRLRVGR
jgi:hypothetical protein